MISKDKKFNVLFMGTTDFSEALLLELLDMSEIINIVGVVCQPDRVVGRKKDIIFSPVKQLTLKHNLNLFQPEKIIDQWEKFNSLNIDAIITCAYGQFLPSKILSLPKIVALNLHASLLPTLRGGAPIQWAIIKNLPETGVSLMNMSKKMDAGSVYCQEKVIINSEETYETLKKKLIILSKQIVKKYLLDILNKKMTALEQDESKVTFGLNITRDDELVNWSQSAKLVSCHVRGLYNIPIAYSTLNGMIYKIHQVVVSEEKSNQTPGTIILINKLGIFVATKDYDIIIKKIQPSGKQVISAINYYGSNAFPIKVGMVFN